jgi:hypothetical protein
MRMRFLYHLFSKVLAAVTLTGQRRSAKLALEQAKLDERVFWALPFLNSGVAGNFTPAKVPSRQAGLLAGPPPGRPCKHA